MSELSKYDQCFDQFQDAIIRKILDEEIRTANKRKKSSHIFKLGININAGNRPVSDIVYLSPPILAQ